MYSIILSRSLVTSFFTPTLDKITACLRGLKLQPVLDDLRKVFLVGGFSSSPLLREAVHDVLHNERTCPVLRTDRPDVAIVMGAVLFDGVGRKTVVSRKARLTYGVDTQRIYDPKNPEHKKRRSLNPEHGEDGKERILAFSKHISVNDDIPLEGKCEKVGYVPLRENQTHGTFHIYGCHERDVEFLDQGTFKLGHVRVPVDRKVPFEERGVEVQFMFGGTEIFVTAFHQKTGAQVAEVKVDLIQTEAAGEQT